MVLWVDGEEGGVEVCSGVVLLWQCGIVLVWSCDLVVL